MKRPMNATPTTPDPALEEALALHRQGKLELAMQRYVAILQQNPGNADALYYVAVIALQEHQFDEGLRVIARAFQVAPPQARLYNLQGQAHLRLNQDAEALQSFSRAIECDADFIDAYGNRATLLAEMGRLDDAIRDYDHALRLRPDNAEDLCNRAGVVADLGRLDEALAGFNRAIALLPQLAPAYFNRGKVLVRLGRPDQALRDFDKAIELVPGMPDAHCSRAIALKDLGRLDEAKASLEQALTLDPNHTDALINRGNVAYELGRYDDAQADYQRALERRADSAEAHYGRALVSLARSDWDTGFRLLEHRERLKEPPFKPLPYPRWTGDAAPGERLVLVAEQGPDDMIQFSRFAPVIAERGVEVTLLAPERMHRLLRTLEGVKVAGYDDAPPAGDEHLRWLPLMSAPGVLGVRPDNVPGKVPYLAADEERTALWREKLGDHGFRIGIVWAPDMPPRSFARGRDIPLAAFAPLAAIPDARLIALQKGPPLQQIATVPFARSIEVVENDPDPGADNFIDTAAVMMNLDLIVTCDDAMAHLAGALGRPVFTALPPVPGWRWQGSGPASPWYPSMVLFRAERPNDWDGLFARIAEAAAALKK